MPALWKSALLGYFWTSVVLNYYHIWNHQPQVCIFAKFCQKNKNVYVMEKCFIWLLLDFNCIKLLSYLKSAPLHSYICKILRKNKNAYIMKKWFIWLFLDFDCIKLLSYLKSGPWNLNICKVLRKNKIAYVMEKCLI